MNRGLENMYEGDVVLVVGLGEGKRRGKGYFGGNWGWGFGESGLCGKGSRVKD